MDHSFTFIHVRRGKRKKISWIIESCSKFLILHRKLPNILKGFLPRAHIIIIREKRTMAGVMKERKFIVMDKQNFYTNVVDKILINSTVQVNSRCNTQEWSTVSVRERDIQMFVHNTISHLHANLFFQIKKGISIAYS